MRPREESSSTSFCLPPQRRRRRWRWWWWWSSLLSSRSNDLSGMIIRIVNASTILWILIGISLLDFADANLTLYSNKTFVTNLTEWDTVLQDSMKDYLPNNASSRASYFTNWSDWSVCDRHCTQNRVKRCRLKKQCGTTVLREERSCEHKGKRRRKSCRQRQNKESRRKKQKFHVVQVPKETEPRHGKRRVKDTKDQRGGNYGRWSKWSPCTRLCTTQRHRWCRKPGICGRDVIRETAYCYVEGSFCQKWIHRKIRGSQEDENNNDFILDEFELNPNTVEGIVPDKTINEWKCGVANAQRNSRLSYFTRIIGGRPAVPGSWPWQVAVLNRFREAFCGGTLVSPRWILTAAHCIRKRLYVRIGEHDLTVKEGTELEFRVDSIMVHPDYDADTVDNDVALLRLPISLSISSTRGIACLPAPKQPLPSNQLCIIIGWGKSRVTDDFGTDVLHEAKIPIVPTETCRNVYVDYRITENMFCAGYLKGKMDSCAGDSGGPLLCRDLQKPDHPWTIFGITSFGEGCGKRGKFGIYARITNYVRWITKVMKKVDEFT